MVTAQALPAPATDHGSLNRYLPSSSRPYKRSHKFDLVHFPHGIHLLIFFFFRMKFILHFLK